MPRSQISALNRSIFAAAAGFVPLLVAPALAAPFSLLVVDTGGVPGGTLGLPISVGDGSTFFRAPVAVSQYGLPPSPELVAMHPVAEYTSYLAMGGEPVNSYDAANPAAYIIGPQFDVFLSGTSRDPAIVTGIRANFPIVVVDPIANPFGVSPSRSVPGPMGADTVFLGRLTVHSGQQIVAPKIVLGAVFTTKSGAKTQSLMANAALDGPAEIYDVSAKAVPVPSSALVVRSYLFAQVNIPGWGPADVYDLYAVSESDPPKTLTAKPAAKPKAAKPVKTKAKQAKKTQPATRTPEAPQLPDDSNIIYKPSSSGTSGRTGAASVPVTTATPVPAPAVSPATSLVKQIMNSMGFQ